LKIRTPPSDFQGWRGGRGGGAVLVGSSDRLHSGDPSGSRGLSAADSNNHGHILRCGPKSWRARTQPSLHKEAATR
jgi:hypothetical protein